MKRIITGLLVLIIAVTSVYASVTFSGKVVAGYTFSFNDYYSDDVKYYGRLYGEDNLDSEYAKVNIAVTNKEESVSATLDGALYADGRLGADFSFQLMDLFDLETDFSLKFALKYDDRISALRAYNNTYSLAKNADRLRTIESGVGFYIEVGYGSLVSARFGLVPELNANTKTGNQHLSGTASVLLKPLDGLEFSLGYVYYPGNTASELIFLSSDGNSEADHAWGAAFDANIAKLVGLDFDLGISASYVGGYNRVSEEVGAVILTTVYGGYDFINLGAEFGVVVNPSTYLAFVQGQDVQYTLQVVAQLNVVVPVTIFFGCPNLEEIGDRWFAGANVGVGWKGIYFFLQVEYSTLGTLSDHYCIGNGEGFSITPFFTFSF